MFYRLFFFDTQILISDAIESGAPPKFLRGLALGWTRKSDSDISLTHPTNI